MIRTALILAAAAGTAATANAGIQITEFMYTGEGDEFFELTNTGTTPVDMAGWVYDDSSRVFSPSNDTGADIPDPLDPEEELDAGLNLGSFGIIQPGESVVVHEGVDFVFRADWNLDPSVKTIELYENNLGRNDEINIFDASGNLVDRLTYNDQDFPGEVRARGFSANPKTLAALGANDYGQWQLASEGDVYGSYASLAVDPDDNASDIASPGFFQIPTPASAALLGLAGLGAARRRR